MMKLFEIIKNICAVLVMVFGGISVITIFCFLITYCWQKILLCYHTWEALSDFVFQHRRDKLNDKQ